MRIETERLILREWKSEDLPRITDINKNAHVSEFFGTPMTEQQSFEAVSRYQAAHARDGFSFLAAELKDTSEFIGIIGMQTMNLEVPGLAQPAVEIGWRVAHHHWGSGLATEGASGVLSHAFNYVHLPMVVAITSAINVRSRRVMAKLGMAYRDDLDFNHPLVPSGHALQTYVVYLLEATDFLEASRR